MCNGLPGEECPHSARSNNEFFRYAELNLCSFCEHERRKLNGAHVSDDLAKEFNILKKKTEGDTSVKCIPSNNLQSQKHITRHSSSKLVTSTLSDEPIINPLLSYILFSLSSGTVSNIVKAVVNHFSLEVIEEAKALLWSKCGNSVIGSAVNRRDSAVRSKNEAHVQDIICALQKLDRANISLNVVIHAHDLGMIPRSHPEELMSISVIDCLNKMEQKLTNL